MKEVRVEADRDDCATDLQQCFYNKLINQLCYLILGKNEKEEFLCHRKKKIIKKIKKINKNNLAKKKSNQKLS